ncbi:hypothetical protein K439DRAFT_1619622 [Ramaria rubella]|nr:hypothetical protein K439DRAFT_1619622 [Ramaria rubella]
MLTICKIFLLYKLIEEHLNTGLHDLELEMDNYSLEDAIQAGLDKLATYIDHALVSDYPLMVLFSIPPFESHILKISRGGTQLILSVHESLSTICMITTNPKPITTTSQ